MRRDSEADSEADAEGRRALRIGRQVLQSSKGVTSIKDLSVNELQGLLNSVNNGILLRDSHGSPPALGNHVLDLSLLSQHQHQHSPHDQSKRPALGMAFEPSPTLTPNDGFLPSPAAFHSSQLTSAGGLRDLGPFHNTLSASESTHEDLSEEALLQDPMIQERLQTLRMQQQPEDAAEESGSEGKGDQEGLMSDAELLALMSSPMVAANLDKVGSMEDLVALINAERTRQGSSAETSEEELMRGGKALQEDNAMSFQNVLTSNQNQLERQLLLPPSLNDAAPKPRRQEGGRAKTRIVNNLPSSVNFPDTLGTSNFPGSLSGNPVQGSPTSRPFHNTLPFQPPLPSPHPTLSSIVGSLEGLGGSIRGLGRPGEVLGGPVKIPLGGSVDNHHHNPLDGLVAGSAERAVATKDDLVNRVIQHLKENQPLLSFPNSPTLGHPNPLLPAVHLDHHPPHHHPQPQLVELPDHPPHAKPHPPLPPPTVTKTEVPAPYGCKAYSTKTCQKVPVIVPEKVPVPRCYDVPKVECFQVLAPVADLECAPRAHEECVDIVNEVIEEFQSD